MEVKVVNKKIIGLTAGLVLTLILTLALSLFMSTGLGAGGTRPQVPEGMSPGEFNGTRPGRFNGTQPEGTIPGGDQLLGIGNIRMYISFVVVSVSAVIAGFISSDWKIGLITGIVGGLVVYPLTSILAMSFAFSGMISFLDLLGTFYMRGYLIYILTSVVGSSIGALAGYIRTYRRNSAS
jgi:hypothetical protein